MIIYLVTYYIVTKYYLFLLHIFTAVGTILLSYILFVFMLSSLFVYKMWSFEACQAQTWYMYMLPKNDKKT